MKSPSTGGKTPWATLMVAPIPAVLVYFFIMLRFMPHAGSNTGQAQAVYPLILFYLVFAIPAAYLAEAILYLAAYRRTPRRLLAYLVVASLVGAIVGTQGPKFMLSLPDGMTDAPVAVTAFIAGALGGAVSAIFFWLGVRSEDPLTPSEPA